MIRRMATILASILVPPSLPAQQAITAEAVVEAPVAQVWKAWATSEGLRAWLAPHAEIEAKVGGLMRTNHAASGALGDPQTIENKVLSLEPERMLSIQVVRAPENFPFRAHVGEMWTVLYFTPEPGNRTRLRVVGLGFAADAEAQQMREFFQHGNELTLRQLQDHFAKCQPANSCVGRH